MILQFGIGSQNDNCIESYRNFATCAGKDVILSQDVRTSFLPSCPPKKTLGGYEEVPSTFKLACADSLCNASSYFCPVLVSLLPLLPEDDILGLHVEVSGVSLLFLILTDVLTDDHSSRCCL